MGGQKESSTQTVQRAPTAEETELNKLELEQARAVQPGVIGTRQAGLSLVETLLRGEEPLPGFFQELAGGISPELTSEIAQQAVADIRPSFQSQGILDSGTAASIAARTAGDIRRGVGEFNLGQKLNLLNLALSGQAQIQQPMLSTAANLGGRLEGLRTTTGTTTTRSANPFLSAFQKSLGSGLGTGVAAAPFAAFGGGSAAEMSKGILGAF